MPPRAIRSPSTYDLAPDGKRLAAILTNNEIKGREPSMHLTFLVNFFDELRRKVPVGNSATRR